MMTKGIRRERRTSNELRLATTAALVAGMVNVAALVLFFSFTSNITGHFAILAEEIAKGKWYQVAVVGLWLVLFFGGSFLAHALAGGARGRTPMVRTLPLVLQLLCLLVVGYYGQWHYGETLLETEMLVAVLLLAMGLQNGYTASVTEHGIKTTHLTGLTTDLAIFLSRSMEHRWREAPGNRRRLRLMGSVLLAYVAGGIIAGTITAHLQFHVFYITAGVLAVVLALELVRDRGTVTRTNGAELRSAMEHSGVRTAPVHHPPLRRQRAVEVP